MSGSVTISMSGAPERLKSTRLTLRPSASVAWMSLAVSSSRCARVIADRERAVGRVEGQPAHRRERQVVLADLVALGQVRVEVVLAIPARRGGRRRLDRRAGREDVLDGSPVDRRQRAGQAQADRADVGVGRRAVVRGRTAAEHLGRGPQLAVDLDPDDRLVPFEGGRGAAARGRALRHGPARRTGRSAGAPPPAARTRSRSTSARGRRPTARRHSPGRPRRAPRSAAAR